MVAYKLDTTLYIYTYINYIMVDYYYGYYEAYTKFSSMQRYSLDYN